MAALAFLFLFNNHLIFWWNWPGPLSFVQAQGWFGADASIAPLEGTDLNRGWLQWLLYPAVLAVIAAYVTASRRLPLRADADRLSALAAYIVRAAFWAVFLIGFADMLISFLRVEGLLEAVVGDNLATELGRPSFRGTYVHYPLVAVALVVARFVRSLGFTWLALLVVVAEFQIVILRFVYSYEQAFMGDLVRYWYAALFLFASAYTLMEEGHVRVDVFYTNFSTRTKAWCNLWGSLMLGMSLCWIILTQGMWTKGSSINSPLLTFEISQSGYGMYVKYMMAGFLVIFALTMIIQFMSLFLVSAADLRAEPGHRDPPAGTGS